MPSAPYGMARFRHGQPLMVDYTADADVNAGDIIEITNSGITTYVAHRPIANGDLDALAAGGGVYDCHVIENTTRGTAVGALANGQLTTDLANAAFFGYTDEDGTGTNTRMKVIHDPFPIDDGD